MEQVVHQMGAAEAAGPLPGGTRTEREVGRKVEIGNEAQRVAGRVGYVFIEAGVAPEEKVDAVVERRSEGAHHAEADDFRKRTVHVSVVW